MSNPRNILSQQEVVNNLSSSNDRVPLAANQGRVLNTKVSALESVAGEPLEIVFDHTIDQPLFEMEIGSVSWEVSTRQCKITTNNTFPIPTVCAVVNNTITELPSGLSDQYGISRGAYAVPTSATAYFTADGSSHSLVGLDMSGSVSHITTTLTNSAGFIYLDFMIQLANPTQALLVGSQRIISVNNFFSFRAETPVAQFNSGDFPFSFGDIENTQNTGIVMPLPGRLTSFSYKTSSAIVTSVTFVLVKNGISSTAQLIVPPGGLSGSAFLEPSPLAFDPGDVITIIAPNGTPDSRFYDVLLMGEYRN